MFRDNMAEDHGMLFLFDDAHGEHTGDVDSLAPLFDGFEVVR